MARLLALVAVLASLSMAVACASTANSPEEPDGSVKTTIALTPTSAVAAASGTTGIAGVDVIIAAAVAGDVASLQQRIRYTPIACITMPEGIGAPPFCRDGEAAGTMVDALFSAVCEGFYSRPDEVRLDGLAAGASLYAVYRAPADNFPPGKYVAIFSPPPSRVLGAFALVLDDGSIVGIYFGCNQTPQGFVQFNRLTDALVPPVAVAVTPAASGTAAR